MPPRIVLGLIAVMTAVIALSVPAAAQPAAPDLDFPPPEFGTFDPASVADLDPADVPILPDLTPTALAIFARGQTRDLPRNPQMLAKVGDSVTASVEFLTPLAAGTYDLGEYADLEPVLRFFLDAEDIDGDGLTAFDRVHYATALGFSTASALDSTWSDPDQCEPNETPLACDFRMANPAFALIMFGTNDVLAFDAALFDFFYRQLVLETIAADVVPVLYTMPIRPEAPEQSVVFNQVILGIARDYDLPLINLVVALEPLENAGVDPEDTLHLTTPTGGLTSADFTAEALAFGYPVRNLVTLQTLDRLLRALDLLPMEAA